jgi:hypothetical protein
MQDTLLTPTAATTTAGGDGYLGPGHTERGLPRREGFRTVLRKIASTPSNRRRADAADQSRSRRAADSCVVETDLPGGQ